MTNRTRACCANAVVVAVAMLLAPSLAMAAGMQFPDNSTVAIGRGGAYAANPNDGAALQYNPAGLAQQRGLRIHAEAKIAMQQAEFVPKRASDGDAASNNAAPFVAPAAALSYGFGELGLGVTDFTVALGAYGPSSVGNLSYSETGAQRYSVIEEDLFVAYYSMAAAVELFDLVTAGVTFQLAHGQTKFVQVVESKEVGDVLTTLDASSKPIPTAVVGLTVTPMDGLAIGMSYRPKYTFKATGSLTSVFAEGNDLTLSGADNANLRLSFPDVVRLGVAYDISSRWQVEVGGTYERWSVLDAFYVSAPDARVNGTTSVGAEVTNAPLDLPPLTKGYQDAFSVRIGTEYDVLPMLTVRGGYTFESSAIPDERLALDFPNWERHVLGLGATLTMFGVHLDVAYAHHFMPTRQVTRSEVAPVGISIFESGAVPTRVRGNGAYSGSLDVVSVALRVPLQELSLTPW